MTCFDEMAIRFDCGKAVLRYGFVTGTTADGVVVQRFAVVDPTTTTSRVAELVLWTELIQEALTLVIHRDILVLNAKLLLFWCGSAHPRGRLSVSESWKLFPLDVLRHSVDFLRRPFAINPAAKSIGKRGTGTITIGTCAGTARNQPQGLERGDIRSALVHQRECT